MISILLVVILTLQFLLALLIYASEVIYCDLFLLSISRAHISLLTLLLEVVQTLSHRLAVRHVLLLLVVLLD